MFSSQNVEEGDFIRLPDGRLAVIVEMYTIYVDAGCGCCGMPGGKHLTYMIVPEQPEFIKVEANYTVPQDGEIVSLCLVPNYPE